MFLIEPTALYSRNDLAELLAPLGIDADSWLSKIKPAKRFRMAWWGSDLIRAIETAPLLGEIEAMPEAANRGNRSRRPCTGKALSPLDAIIRGR